MFSVPCVQCSWFICSIPWNILVFNYIYHKLQPSPFVCLALCQKVTDRAIWSESQFFANVDLSKYPEHRLCYFMHEAGSRKPSLHHDFFFTGLGGSVGCAVRLETMLICPNIQSIDCVTLCMKQGVGSHSYTMIFFCRPRWLSWMRRPTGDQEVAGSTSPPPPPRSATFFRGDWPWNIFYGHSLPSTDSRRAVVSFWWKNVHNTG